MHLISVRHLRVAAVKYSDVSKKVEAWHRVVKQASWQNLEEVRKVYRDAEAVGRFTVFNIRSYRLIVSIDYESQTVYYKYFLTHADYDKGVWKNDPYF